MAGLIFAFDRNKDPNLQPLEQSTGALHTRSQVSEIPRTPIAPEIIAVETFQYEIDGAAGAIAGIKFTVNADDDSDANTKLNIGGLGVGLLSLGDSIIVIADSPIIRVDTVGFGLATTASSGSNTAGTVLTTPAVTDANVEAARLEWVFSAGDNVRAVRMALGIGYDTHVLPTRALMMLEGYQYD